MRRPHIEVGAGSDQQTIEWFRRALFFSLCVWGAGVQLNEGIASSGEITTAIILAVWAIRKRAFPSRADLLAWWPLWAFFLWAVTMPTFAQRLPTGTGLARAADWLTIPVAALAWRHLKSGHRQTLLTVWGILLITSCTIAGLQHFGRWPASSTFQSIQWTHIPFDRVYERAPGETERFMGGGLLFHRLKFAHVSSLGVLAALVIGLHQRGSRRVLALLVSALGFVSIIVFPYARAATAGLVGASVVVFASSRLRARSAAVLTAVLVLAGLTITLANPSLRRRFLSSATEEGTGERSKIMATGIQAVKAHPLVGNGVGRFRPSYFAPPGTPVHILENRGKAHNQFLSIAAEVGIPGAMLFLALLAWLASRLNVTTVEGRFGAASLAFFVLLALVHDPLVQAPFSIALALCLGIATSTSRSLWRETPYPPPQR